MSIDVSFYHLPTIDDTHAHVIASMRQYLAIRGGAQVHSVRNFQPRLSPFQIHIARVPVSPGYFSAFNYCTFTTGSAPDNTYMEWGCFVKNIDFETPGTISATLIPDWWYMFVDSDLSGSTYRGSVALSGTVVQSTLFRHGALLYSARDSKYRIPPVFSAAQQVHALPLTGAGSFRVCANISTGTEYALTGNTTGSLGPKITKTYWVMLDRIDDAATATAACELLMNATYVEDVSGVQHGILAINNLQIIPSPLLPSNTIYGSQAMTGKIISGNSQINMLYMLAGWADNFSVDWQIDMPSVLPSPLEAATGKHDRAIFFGNYSKLVQLRDYDGFTPVRIIGAFAGDHLQIMLNCAGEIIDITDGTLLPYAYNNAAGISAMNRTNSILQGVSAGIMVAGSIAASVATGGATAAMLPGAVIGATSSLYSITGRQTEVRSSTAPGLWRNLFDFAMFSYAYAEPGNKRARAWDYLCYGLSGTYSFVSTQIFGMLNDMLNIQNSTYEHTKFSEDTQILVRPHRISPTEVAAPVPGAEIIDDIRSSFVRGISFWLPGSSRTWTVETAEKVGDYSALSGRLT